MAKTIRDKYSLGTLCKKIVPDGLGGWKNSIIGTEIMMEDGTWEEVIDWWDDDATREIHLMFKSGTGDSFDLTEKYVVKIESTYNSVPSQKKKKNHKKKLN